MSINPMDAFNANKGANSGSLSIMVRFLTHMTEVQAITDEEHSQYTEIIAKNKNEHERKEMVKAYLTKYFELRPDKEPLKEAIQTSIYGTCKIKPDKQAALEEVIEDQEGYWLISRRGDGTELKRERLTNFTFVDRHIVFDEFGKSKTYINILFKGKLFKDIVLEPQDLSTAHYLNLKMIEMHSDAEVSALPSSFSHVREALRQIPTIEIVSAPYLGMHFTEDREPFIIYHSSDRSIQKKVKSNVMVPDGVSPPPIACYTDAAIDSNYRFKQVEESEWKQIGIGFLKNYPLINHRQKSVTVLGWGLGSSLKAFIKEYYRLEFPILNLTGLGEVGKGTFIKYISTAIGHTKGTGFNMAILTAKPRKLLMSGSNISPGIVEEYDDGLKLAAELKNTLKSAYDGQGGATGKIGPSETIELVAPMCIIGNYEIQDSALQTRLCRLEIKRNEWEGVLDTSTPLDALDQLDLRGFSYGFYQWLLNQYKHWDDWVAKAKRLSGNESRTTKRESKTMVGIALGLVIAQELCKEVGVSLDEFYGDKAIEDNVEWLTEYLSNIETSVKPIEVQMIEFFAQSHMTFRMNGTYEKREEMRGREAGAVVFHASTWRNRFVEKQQGLGLLGSETPTTIDRAIEANTTGVIKIAPAFEMNINGKSSRQRAYIIDIALAEQIYKIDAGSWSNSVVDPLILD